MAPAETVNPPELLCPILQEVMVDPVVTSAGQTYERRVESWFQRCGSGGATYDPISEGIDIDRPRPMCWCEGRRTLTRSLVEQTLCGASASGQASTSADAPPPPAAPSASSVPTVPSVLSDAVRQMVDIGSREQVDFALENADECGRCSDATPRLRLYMYGDRTSAAHELVLMGHSTDRTPATTVGRT